MYRKYEYQSSRDGVKLRSILYTLHQHIAKNMYITFTNIKYYRYVVQQSIRLYKLHQHNTGNMDITFTNILIQTQM